MIQAALHSLQYHFLLMDIILNSTLRNINEIIYADGLQWREVEYLVVRKKSFLVDICNWERISNTARKKSLASTDRVIWVISTLLSFIYNLLPIILCIKKLIRFKIMSGHSNCQAAMIKMGHPIPQKKIINLQQSLNQEKRIILQRVNWITHLHP